MDDLAGLVEHQKAMCAETKLGLVATSLAGRVALKMASFDKRVDFLVMLAPVVDLRHTLWMTYREDLVANYKKGKRYGTLEVKKIAGFGQKTPGRYLRRSERTKNSS